MSEFVGRRYGNVRVAKFLRPIATVAGFPINHATESTRLGLREEAALTIKQGGPMDSNERPVAYWDEAEFTAKLLQTGLDNIETIFNLARNPHQLFIPTAHPDFFSFVDNTATAESPNGTSLMGLHWKYSHDRDDRNLECTWRTRLFPNETEYLYNNLSAYFGNAASGGSAVGINEGLAYNWDDVNPSSFTDITVDGISIGALGASKFEMESKGWMTIREQEIMQFITIKAEIECGQSAADELKAAISKRNYDGNYKFYCPDGTIFELTNGAGVGSPEFNHTDKEASLKISVSGEVPITQISFAGNTMLFDFAG